MAAIIGDRLGREVLPVQNTFIHFGGDAAPAGLKASRSCPDLTFSSADAAPSPVAPLACRAISMPSFEMRKARDQGEKVAFTKTQTTLKRTPPQDAPWTRNTAPDYMSRVPLSPYDMNIINHASFHAVPALPQFSPSSGGHSGGRRFGFTLRLTGEVRLGVKVDDSSCRRYLIVREILEGGAMAAWNGQCSQSSDRYVLPGDYLVDINGASDCDGMIQECREKALLKMTIVRSDNKHTMSFAGMGQTSDS